MIPQRVSSADGISAIISPAEPGEHDSLITVFGMLFGVVAGICLIITYFSARTHAMDALGSV
jgi:hypothetical protein